MAAEKQVKTPFYLGAKLRYVDDSLQNGGKLNPFAQDTTSNLALRKVGLLCGLLIRVQVTATLGAGTPVMNEEGLYGLIKRVQVIIGNQQAQPIDLTASGLRHVQKTAGHQAYAGYDVASVGKSVPLTTLWSNPITPSAANVWVATFLIPFSANLHKERHLGFLPTSAKGFTANLVIDWAKTAEIITGVTCAFSASTIEVQAITLDTPNYDSVETPSFYIISRKSVKQGAVLNGENPIEILQGGRLMSIGGVLRVNGLRENSIDKLGIRLNGSNNPFEQRLWQNHADNKRKLSIDMPTGEWMLNFMDSFNEMFSGIPRDTIDTGKTGLTEVVMVVNSANLAVNPSLNTIETIRSTMHAINVNTENTGA